MATNIEQIFRSFVVSKFREIQQELSSGRNEGQLNGETNTPIEGNQAGDAAASARSLPNEEIVQKIEEVLSGVLDTELRYKPDKAQLLEIAKANAAAMCAKAGVPLPPNLKPAPPPTIEEKVAKKSGGATIEELTEKCKQIAQSKEDDDVIVNKPHVSDEEEEEPPFYHHPFKLSEPKPIFFNLNIAAAKPTPPKSQVTLTKEFPVSSGSQHRKKEADSVYGEWVPVEKNGEENKDDDNVFSSNLPSEPVDISTAMSERALAQKRLSENAFDLEAMSMLNRAQERIDAWAQLNSIPGQFTGSTGVQVLTQEQLANTGAQAWIKKACSLEKRDG
uniref:SON DNA and RNA binding protein n=1 Tax=Homo sapiens TaxID=9606 RepID=A0A8Q3SI10_HUMAN